MLLWPTSSAGQLFEFMDDFTKSPHRQRDPFEERIETERHDFTQSAVTVGRGIFQVESGYTFFYKDADEVIETAHAAPEMMLRAGLSEDIELRVRWNHVWISTDEEEDLSGAEDMRYGLKLQLTRQPSEGWLPTSALEIRGTAPTGHAAFSTDQAEFSLDLIYQWELSEGFTFAGSTGYGTNGFGDFGLIPEEPTSENFNSLTQSAVFGTELTESNTAYAEWYGIYSGGLEDEFVVSVFNVGVDHYLTQDLLIDIRAGMGLTNDSDDFFAGVGGGYRF
jgi:hypothetical protein